MGCSRTEEIPWKRLAGVWGLFMYASMVVLGVLNDTGYHFISLFLIPSTSLSSYFQLAVASLFPDTTLFFGLISHESPGGMETFPLSLPGVTSPCPFGRDERKGRKGEGTKMGIR